MPAGSCRRSPDRRLDVAPRDDLRTFRPTGRLGRPAFLVRGAGSTNAVVKALARAGLPEGTLVATDRQTRGRGRMGRRWTTPPGSALLCSVLLRPGLPPGLAPLLPLLWGVAAAEAIHAAAGLEATLKWPNDVLIGGKKVAGILSEGALGRDRLEWAVLGCGLNVHQARFDGLPEATSLALEGGNLTRAGLLAALLGAAERHYEVLLGPGGAERVVGAYRPLCATLGKEIRLRQGEEEIAGRALDIDGQGRLVIEGVFGRRVLASGEVTSHKGGAQA